jgi:hypothetical protein
MAKFGAYELLERIGVGGMGEIFLAVLRREGAFEKLLVIKRILPALSRDADFVAMFHREARIAALLNHQHLVQVYDYGKEGDEYFIAMELVEGADLRSLLEQLGRPPRAVAAHILRAVARALDYAHRLCDRRSGECLQLVHRDISPGNVLISREGGVKLTDFGLVASGRAGFETDGGTLKGKYAYMSPEQTYSDPLDARSDLFSWGILAYELFEGHRPFEGEIPELVDGIRAVRFQPVSSGDLPDELVGLIHQCLALHPDDRPSDAAEVAERLERIVATQDWLDGERALCDWARPACRDRAAARTGSDELATAVGHAPIRATAPTDAARTPDEGTPAEAEGSSAPASAPRGPGSVSARGPQRTGHGRWAALLALLLGASTALAVSLAPRDTPPDEGSASASTAQHGARPPAPPDATPAAIAVAVEVRSRPPGASIRVDGREIGTAPVYLPDLQPGAPITIEGHIEGYEPSVQTVRPGDLPAAEGPDGPRLLELSHAPRPATLAVTTEPPGVEVALGDDVVGRTPLELATELVGSQPLTFQAEGYRSVAVTVDLARGRRTSHHEVMTPIATLAVAGTPHGALVEITTDTGEAVSCTSPCELVFDAAPFGWQASAPGFGSASGRRDAGHSEPLAFALEPARQVLQAQWRGGEGVEVRADRALLEGEEVSQSIDFAIAPAGVTGSVLARFAPAPNGEHTDLTVRVAVSPSWARVRLEGGGEAGTPCELTARTLGPGTHSLQIAPSGSAETYSLLLRLRALRE